MISELIKIPPWGRGCMNAPIDHKRHPGSYFHLYPLHTIYSLLMSFLLTAMIVLALVASAR